MLSYKARVCPQGAYDLLCGSSGNLTSAAETAGSKWWQLGRHLPDHCPSLRAAAGRGHQISELWYQYQTHSCSEEVNYLNY